MVPNVDHVRVVDHQRAVERQPQKTRPFDHLRLQLTNRITHVIIIIITIIIIMFVY